MAEGRRTFQLRESRPLPRWLAWLRPQGEPLVPAWEAEGIDYTLEHRAALRAIRGFISGIVRYQLHSRRVVHVASQYNVPEAPGLRERVPEWLAERLRFGVVVGEARAYRYLDIEKIEVLWNEQGTQLFLHLEHPIDRGSQPFVSAWLHDEEQEGDDLPTTRMLGEPR